MVDMVDKVLLLDDDADQIEVLALAISLFCGRTCVTARSYEELTRLADSALSCAVALLDINLGPQQPSGLDALRWLRGHDFKGRVWFLTGHARSHPLVARALAMGEARLVEKPIETDHLCMLVTGGKA
jgi:DNA-binding NtrC family response regulator